MLCVPFASMAALRDAKPQPAGARALIDAIRADMPPLEPPRPGPPHPSPALKKERRRPAPFGGTC